MKKLIGGVIVVSMLLVSVSVCFGQGEVAKNKLNINADNVKRAIEILNHNKQFFSNPENLKTFNRVAGNMNKKKDVKIQETTILSPIEKAE